MRRLQLLALFFLTALLTTGPASGQVDKTVFSTQRETLADQAIAKALTQRVDLQLVDVPLSRLAEQLSSKFEINVLVDERSLNDEGIEAGNPVTLNVANVSLADALETVLEPLGLTFITRSGSLQITTKTEAETSLVTRVYKVGDLLGQVQDPTGQRYDDYDTLIGTLTTTVAPTEFLYVVQSGDTLGKIAERFSVSIAAIVERNGLSSADDIQAGQSLEIPEGLLVIDDGRTTATSEP